MTEALSVAAIVTALYRALLMREPEPEGLAGHAGALAAGTRTLEETIAGFMQCEEFRAIAPRLLRERLGAEAARFTNDHSQYGEFLIWLRAYVNAAARHRIVVDVGANGRERSNSYDLMREFGWRGLLVEANPGLIAGIERDFAGLDYALVASAVSDFEGEATLHLGINSDVSSLTEGAARAWGETKGCVRVPVRRLPGILADHAIPRDFDLLSIDIEGEDVKVLNDVVAAGYRPGWVIIEVGEPATTTALSELGVLARVVAGYGIVGRTSPNLILRRQEGSSFSEEKEAKRL